MDDLLLFGLLPFVFAFGASVGSFLNVVAYRIPANLSLVSPPSRCPHCYHPLGKTENVPVLGWLWLKGKCRWCKTPISSRYPIVEAVTGLLFCFVFWHFGWDLTTLGYWVLISWLLALALIDWDTMTLPGQLTQSGLVAGLIFQGLKGWQTNHLVMTLVGAIASAVLGLWLFDVIRLVGTLLLGKVAMGDGDPKLAAMIGAWLGWQLMLMTAFIACFIGAIAGGSAIALGRWQRRQGFPFGPFLAGGALISLFFGQAILQAYTNIFFPTF
ncbi:MAG: A24 family peptidase [Snowella sp.]|nr:A24 family peptidase [Snowella sp.]